MSSSRRVNPWIFAAAIGGVLLVVAVVTSAGAVARSLTAPLRPGLQLATRTAAPPPPPAPPRPRRAPPPPPAPPRPAPHPAPAGGRPAGDDCARRRRRQPREQ